MAITQKTSDDLVSIIEKISSEAGSRTMGGSETSRVFMKAMSNVVNEVAGESDQATLNIPGNTDLLTEIDFSKYISGTVLLNLAGVEVEATGTVDTDNVSSNDAALVDGGLSSICYNNSITGTVNKPMVGMDLGAPDYSVEMISVWWYNSPYTATNFKIQGSYDGNSWDDISTNLNSNDDAGQQVDYSIPVSTYRYYRIFSVQGNNASYVVLYEMKAFGASITVEKSIESVFDIEMFNEGEKLLIRNTSSQNKELTINYKL